MTEGTSQGLFIVVAIVIFGIFVSLSYTLFGSQGLSNDLKGLFSNAIEQSTGDSFKASSDDVNKCLDDGYSNQSIEDDNYTYTFNEKCTEIKISNYKHSSIPTDKVVIPDRFKGIPITKTENLINGRYTTTNGFVYVKVKKVVLPNTIKEIGRNSFNYGVIEDINFPKNLKVIGAGAFDKTNLGSVVLPDGLEEIGALAFRHAQVTSINLPKTLTSIGNRAFSGQNYVKEYKIPESVKYVDEGAFQKEEHLGIGKISIYFNSQFTKLENINGFYTLGKHEYWNMVAGNDSIYDLKTGTPVDVTVYSNAVRKVVN